MRRKRARNEKSINVTLQQLFAEKIEMMKTENRPSHLNYQSLSNHLTELYGAIPMADVNPRFAKAWHADMIAEGVNNSTISLRFCLLKSIFNYAIYKGYARPEDYPFQRKSYEIDKVKIPKPNKRTEQYLTRDEMSELYRHFISMSPQNHKERTAQNYLGLFLFSYLANGANVVDLMMLKYDGQWKRSGGKALYFTRHKTADRTASKVVIPIIEPMRNILAVIGNEPRLGDYVLNGYFNEGYDFGDIMDIHRNSVRLCSQIKKVLEPIAADILDMEKLSMTYARHSYSTVLHNLGAPHHIVERNMGHACNGVAFNYIGETPLAKLFEINELLLDLK